MSRMKPGQDIGGCEHDHLGEALADMTNQQLEFRSDPWLAWWATNQNRTQVEWIRDGFARNGIKLEEPLTTNNIIALLKPFHSSTNSDSNDYDLRYQWEGLHFNAFRWLRDTGFSPFGFDLSAVPLEDRDEVTKGLIHYAFWYGYFREDAGNLFIGERQADNLEFEYAAINRPPYTWLPQTSMIVLVVVGILLLCFKPNHPSKHSSPADSPAMPPSRPAK